MSLLCTIPSNLGDVNLYQTEHKGREFYLLDRMTHQSHKIRQVFSGGIPWTTMSSSDLQRVIYARTIYIGGEHRLQLFGRIFGGSPDAEAIIKLMLTSSKEDLKLQISRRMQTNIPDKIVDVIINTEDYEFPGVSGKLPAIVITLKPQTKWYQFSIYIKSLFEEQPPRNGKHLYQAILGIGDPADAPASVAQLKQAFEEGRSVSIALSFDDRNYWDPFITPPASCTIL